MRSHGHHHSLQQISHTAAGFNIANAAVGVWGAKAGERYSIHDIVMDDIVCREVQRRRWFVPGDELLAQANAERCQRPAHNRHPGPKRPCAGIANSLNNPQMYGFTFSDNVVVVPTYPVWSAGAINDCAIADVPITVFAACFKTYSVTNNVFAGVTKAFPAVNGLAETSSQPRSTTWDS